MIFFMNRSPRRVPRDSSLKVPTFSLRFAGNTGTEIAPTPEDVAGFEAYLETYKSCLAVERAAVKSKK